VLHLPLGFICDAKVFFNILFHRFIFLSEQPGRKKKTDYAHYYYFS
jgi:hypothetical protein